VRDLTYPAVVRVATTGFKLLGVKLQLRGTENVPRTGPAVLAFNHISYVDFIFGGYAAVPSKRLVRFMAKKEIFDHRFAGPLMRSLHHISVDRSDGMPSYQTALEYLAAGELVGVFPEATISYTYELKEFKSGTVRLAAQAGVPIIPVLLWGTQRMFPKGRKPDYTRGQTLAITVGEPMDIDARDALGETARVRAEMSRLLDETIRAYPEMPAGAWWLPRSYGGSAPDTKQAEQMHRDERRQMLAMLRKQREERERAQG
jgi:1-acyl-sn-glycerol-3-phosphate acyltransferase